MAERGHRTPAWIPFKEPIFPVGPIIRGGLARATLGERRADLMASLLDADDQGPRDRAQIGAALLVVSVVALLTLASRRFCGRSIERPQQPERKAHVGEWWCDDLCITEKRIEK